MFVSFYWSTPSFTVLNLSTSKHSPTRLHPLLHSTTTNPMIYKLIQTKKQEYKTLYLNSLQLLLKFEEHPGCNLRQSVYSTQQRTKGVSLWFYRTVGQLVRASLKTIKPRVWPCTLQQRAEPQHEHGATCWGEWVSPESTRVCSFPTCVAVHISNSLSALLVKNAAAIKYTQACKKHMGAKSYTAKARCTSSQHEWWFSRSAFRGEEQEASAGWFSASISYKRGHFSARGMTYEGTAAAFISILLWGMVAKVSLYLLSKLLHKRTEGQWPPPVPKGLFPNGNVMLPTRTVMVVWSVFNFQDILLNLRFDKSWNVHTYAGRGLSCGTLQSQCPFSLLSLTDREQWVHTLYPTSQVQTSAC